MAAKKPAAPAATAKPFKRLSTDALKKLDNDGMEKYMRKLWEARQVASGKSTKPTTKAPHSDDNVTFETHIPVIHQFDAKTGEYLGSSRAESAPKPDGSREPWNAHEIGNYMKAFEPVGVRSELGFIKRDKPLEMPKPETEPSLKSGASVIPDEKKALYKKNKAAAARAKTAAAPKAAAPKAKAAPKTVAKGTVKTTAPKKVK